MTVRIDMTVYDDKTGSLRHLSAAGETFEAAVGEAKWLLDKRPPALDAFFCDELGPVQPR